MWCDIIKHQERARDAHFFVVLTISGKGHPAEAEHDESEKSGLPHSIELSGKSLKPATGKDLKIDEPIRRRHLSALHFDCTFP